MNTNQEPKMEIMQIEEVKALPETVVHDLQAAFNPLFVKATEWQKKAKAIKVTSVEDVEGMKAARAARLELKNIRVDAEKVRKQLKEDSLRKGKAIDGIYNVIEFLIKPLEDQLMEQEKFAELQEQKRLDDLENSRKAELAQYVDDVSIYNLRVMSEEAFAGILGNAKGMWETKQAEAKKAKEEEERLAKERAEEAERNRIKAEQLEKEKAERDRKYKILVNAGFKFESDGENFMASLVHKLSGQQIKMEKLLETSDTQLQKMADKAAAAEKKESDRLAKEQAARDEQAKKDREAREKAEKELAEQRKAEADRKAAEEAAAKKLQEEKRQAELAPDKEKIKAFANQLFNMEYPTVANPAAKELIGKAEKVIVEFAQKLNKAANEL